MGNTSQKRIRALVESSLLVAVGFALSFVPLPFLDLPFGGKATPVSMLPIIMIGLRHGLGWGLGGGLVYACLQMLQGIYPPPSGEPIAWVAVIGLDYIVAFTVLGLSGLFKSKKYGVVFAVILCLSIRFLCHFISGVAIWSAYKPDDMSAWLYSLVYNGAYMSVELILTTIVGMALYGNAPVLFNLPDYSKNTVQ